MQKNNPPAPFPTAPGYRLDNGLPASPEVKFVREGFPKGESFLAIKAGNRAPYFSRPWVVFPLTGVLWTLIIWAALWIGGAV